MDNIVPLFGEINPNAVVDEVLNKEHKMQETLDGFNEVKEKFDNVIIIGSSADGRFYYSASSGDARQILFDIESAKQMTLDYAMAFRPIGDNE